MTPTLFLLWLSTIVFDTCGQLMFKAAARKEHPGQGWAYWRFILGQPLILAGILCYLLVFLLWLAFLAAVPLALAILLSSINIITLMLAGHWLFDERLTPWRVVGMLLVAAGVTLSGVTS